MLWSLVHVWEATLWSSRAIRRGRAVSGRRQTWLGDVRVVRAEGLGSGAWVARRLACGGGWDFKRGGHRRPARWRTAVSARIGLKRRRRGRGVPEACGMAGIATPSELISLCLALRPRLSHLSYATASVKSTALQGEAAQQFKVALNAPPKRARPPRRIVKGQCGCHSLTARILHAGGALVHASARAFPPVASGRRPR